MGPRSRLSGSEYRKKAAAKALQYASVMKKTGKINKFFSQASQSPITESNAIILG